MSTSAWVIVYGCSAKLSVPPSDTYLILNLVEHGLLILLTANFINFKLFKNLKASASPPIDFFNKKKQHSKL